MFIWVEHFLSSPGLKVLKHLFLVFDKIHKVPFFNGAGFIYFDMNHSFFDPSSAGVKNIQVKLLKS